METTSVLMQKFSKIHTDITSIGCMDAGGTKTFFQLFDKNGTSVSLFQNEISKESLIGKAANMSSLSKETVEKHLKELFKDVTLDNTPIHDHLSKTFLICGAAGASKEETKNELLDILSSCGFQKNNIYLCNDAELILELAYNKGVAVIAGTGSVCFGKKNEEIFRSGGLGRFLGDEGSGHHIGMLAMKAALSNELGFGIPTSLLCALKKHFQSESLKHLTGPFNRGELSGGEVASLALYVFQEAEKGDSVSIQIAQQSATFLSELLIQVLDKLSLHNEPVYLYGSLFKSPLLYSIFRKKLHECYGVHPLLINLGEENIASLVIRELLLRQEAPLYSKISSLPVFPNKQDNKTFSLTGITTEQGNPLTEKLSAFFPNEVRKGLEVLIQAEDSIIPYVALFQESKTKQVAETLQDRMKDNGRLFLVGAGSSGRAGLLLAHHFPKHEKLIPLLAGGVSAFVRAKEGAEDSFEEGYNALKEYHVSKNDTVLLISASGVARFNLGVASYAKEHSCHVYALSHTSHLPSHAEKAFNDLGIERLILDAGPQSITGSTRLQAANCTILGIGSILEALEGQSCLLDGYKQIPIALRRAIPDLEKLIKLGHEVFSSPEANFSKPHDVTNKGYITYLGNQDTIIEILMDTTETAPTFSINPPRKTSELGMKEAEMRAYLLEEKDNVAAWEALAGRPLFASEAVEASSLCITTNMPGFGSYLSRQVGKGNLLIATIKTPISEKEILLIQEEIQRAKQLGGKTALITIFDQKNTPSIDDLAKQCDAAVFIGPIVYDQLKILPSLALKQTLNMVSNSIMSCIGKIFGNVMIDVSPSNAKLILRAARIIKELFIQEHPQKTVPNDELIREVLIRIFYYKQMLSRELGHELPSPVKIALTMFEHSCDLAKALLLLSSTGLSSCSCSQKNSLFSKISEHQ